MFNSDISFITAGALASTQFFDFRILIILGFFALMIGDSVVFFSARRWGKRLLKRKPFSIFLNDEKIKRAESFIHRRGKMFLFFVRFLPLIRTALFFTAGTLHLKPLHFYALNGLATLIYLPLVIMGGYQAGANASVIVETLKKYQMLPLVFVLGIFAVMHFKRKVKRKA